MLAQVLWRFEVYVTPIILGVPGHRGGRPNYARVKKDILLQLKQDRARYCTSMLDFYGLGPGFPGSPLSSTLTSLEKAIRVEHAMKADIVAEAPDLRSDIRFLPYLQLHEYEALLFSDPGAFAFGIRKPLLSREFERIRNGFATPEDINDKPETAPSKQVLSVYPGYRKPVDGTLAAQAVGIDQMRQQCPHFRTWIESLQALGAN